MIFSRDIAACFGGGDMVFRAGPLSRHWSSQDSIKYIKQSGVTLVNQDGCQSAMTFWFKKETT